MVPEQETLVGVLSERDVIRKVVCAGRHSAETPLADIMTPAPRTMEASGDLAQALDIMSEGGFHHVPILDNDTAVGLPSADDIPGEYRMMPERFREMRSC